MSKLVQTKTISQAEAEKVKSTIFCLEKFAGYMRQEEYFALIKLINKKNSFCLLRNISNPEEYLLYFETDEEDALEGYYYLPKTNLVFEHFQ